MLIKQWDYLSLIIYILVASFGVVCLYKGRAHNEPGGLVKTFKFSKIVFNKYYLIWFLVWVMFAVTRYVSPEIGGTDAPTYIEYFEKCLDSVSNLYSYRTEPTFRLFTQIVRFTLLDYHIYFLIIYSIIVIGIINLLDSLTISKIYYGPILAVFSYYLVSFNILRNGFSIGLLLIAFNYAYNNAKLKATVLALISVLMHTVSVLYAPFIVFYWFLRDKTRLTFRRLTIIAIGVMVGFGTLCEIIKQLILSGALNTLFSQLGLGQPFNVYASNPNGDNFWVDLLAFKIARPQIIIMLLAFIFVAKINDEVLKKLPREINKLRIIELMMVYDFALLPVCYEFNIYRGKYYFLIARVLMIGLLCWLLSTRVTDSSKKYIGIISIVLSIVYLTYQISMIWEESSLMPYIWEPIGVIYNSFIR